MAINQIILEGQLASAAKTNEYTIEFLIAYQEGFDRKLRGLFPVSVWRTRKDVSAEIHRAKHGDPIVVFGHLRGHPWEVKIEAVAIKRLKRTSPHLSNLDAADHLICSEAMPL